MKHLVPEKDPGAKQAHVLALRSRHQPISIDRLHEALLKIGFDSVERFDDWPESGSGEDAHRVTIFRVFEIDEWMILWTYASRVEVASALSAHFACPALNAEMIRGPWELSAWDSGRFVDSHTPDNDLYWEYGSKDLLWRLSSTGQGQGRAEVLGALFEKRPQDLKPILVHLSQAEAMAIASIGVGAPDEMLLPQASPARRPPLDWYAFLDVLHALGVPKINEVAWNEQRPTAYLRVTGDISSWDEPDAAVDLDEFDSDLIDIEIENGDRSLSKDILGELPTTAGAGAGALQWLASKAEWPLLAGQLPRIEKLPALELAAVLRCCRWTGERDALNWCRQFAAHESVLVRLEGSGRADSRNSAYEEAIHQSHLGGWGALRTLGAAPEFVDESIRIQCGVVRIRHYRGHVLARALANLFRASIAQDIPAGLQIATPSVNFAPWVDEMLAAVRKAGLKVDWPGPARLEHWSFMPEALDGRPIYLALDEAIRCGAGRFGMKWENGALKVFLVSEACAIQ